MEENKLSSMKCRACKGIEDKLRKNEIEKYSKLAKNWKIMKNEYIIKKFKFKDFKSALEFVNKIGEIAEKEDHHPNIELAYGEVNVKLFTHAVKGLSINDFILASKIDEIKA